MEISPIPTSSQSSFQPMKDSFLNQLTTKQILVTTIFLVTVSLATFYVSRFFKLMNERSITPWVNFDEANEDLASPRDVHLNSLRAKNFKKIVKTDEDPLKTDPENDNPNEILIDAHRLGDHNKVIKIAKNMIYTRSS